MHNSWYKTTYKYEDRKSTGYKDDLGGQEKGRYNKWEKKVASEWVLTRPNLPQSRVYAWKFARQRSNARTGWRIIEKLQRYANPCIVNKLLMRGHWMGRKGSKIIVDGR